MLSTKTLCKALPQKSEGSANGAEYKSPGQARSASPWVTTSTRDRGLKGRNIYRQLRPFRAASRLSSLTRGDALASLRACPWLSYFAPLALRIVGNFFGCGAAHNQNSSRADRKRSAR